MFSTTIISSWNLILARRGGSPRNFAVLFTTAGALWLSAGQALAQPSRQQTRLLALQQNNALQQQQFAVQAAVQQTTSLVQKAYRSIRGTNGATSVVAFQSQQYALQIALQQTNTLVQVASRSNSGLAQMAMRQQNALQTALQQTMAIQNSLSTPGTTLTVSQLQTLFQEQSTLAGLQTSAPPQVRQKPPGK